MLLSYLINTSIGISEEKVYIELTVENKIITNVDINKEKKYLFALNNNLKNLDKKQIYEISKDSLIKEKVKEIELLNYFDLNTSNYIAEDIVKKFIKNLNFNSEKEFERYLQEYDLTMDDIKKKFVIEASWNQLIYNKFNKNVKVDKDKLKIKLNEELKKNKLDEFNLSEILFELKTGENINKKFESIKNFIKNNNFENAANIFSISDSAKFGGKIGWTNKAQISKNILNEIANIKTGEISKPIQVNNAYLIIKLNKIRTVEQKINIDLEMKKLILSEKNRQLNQYSLMYYNKIKNNLFINEL